MRVVGQQELLLYSLKRSKSRPAQTNECGFFGAFEGYVMAEM
jgi:hypothetical protein